MTNRKVVRLSLANQLMVADFIKLNYADKKLTQRMDIWEK